MEKKSINKFIYWIPRVLSIVFIFFLFLMSLDIFSMNLGWLDTIIGLFMHNIPAFLLLIVLIISWKHEIVGGIAYILAGLLYIILLMMGNFELHMIWWIIQISGTAFLIGALFLIGWIKKRG